MRQWRKRNLTLVMSLSPTWWKKWSRFSTSSNNPLWRENGRSFCYGHSTTIQSTDSRHKNIDQRQEWVQICRDSSRIVTVEHVPGILNVADIMTKYFFKHPGKFDKLVTISVIGCRLKFRQMLFWSLDPASIYENFLDHNFVIKLWGQNWQLGIYRK